MRRNALETNVRIIVLALCGWVALSFVATAVAWHAGNIPAVAGGTSAGGAGGWVLLEALKALLGYGKE